MLAESYVFKLTVLTKLPSWPYSQWQQPVNATKKQTSLIEAPLRAVPAAVSADADVAECFDAWDAAIAATGVSMTSFSGCRV